MIKKQYGMSLRLTPEGRNNLLEYQMDLRFRTTSEMILLAVNE